MFKNKHLLNKAPIKKQPSLFSPTIYVDSLDLFTLGFKDTRKSSNSDGNRAYHPGLLLKIYIYSYLKFT